MSRNSACGPGERMNSPLEIRKVRLRGLGGPAVCGIPRTCASATRPNPSELRPLTARAGAAGSGHRSDGLFAPPVPMQELPATLNRFDMGVFLLEPTAE